MVDDSRILAKEARSRRTSPDRLAELAFTKHKSVVQAALRNPRCPEHVLYDLYGQASDGFLRTRWLDPFILSNPSCPPDLLRQAVVDEHPYRTTAIRNPSCPEDVLRHAAAVSADKPPQNAAAVAANPSCPPDILDVLSRNEATYVRCCVAENKKLAGSIVERLASDPDPRVRKSVARRRPLPASLVTSLSMDPDGNVRSSVAARRDLDPATVSRLARQGGMKSDLRLAGNPLATTDDLRLVLPRAMANKNILRRILEHPNCPPEAVERVAVLGHHEVRVDVAADPGTPPELLESMVDSTSDTDVLSAAAQNPSTPEHARSYASLSL